MAKVKKGGIDDVAPEGENLDYDENAPIDAGRLDRFTWGEDDPLDIVPDPVVRERKSSRPNKDRDPSS